MSEINPYDSPALEQFLMRSPELPVPQNPAAVRRAAKVAWIWVAIANVALILIAGWLGDFNALMILGLGGPIVNLMSALIGMVMSMVVANDARGASIRSFIVAGIVFPLAAIPVDWFILANLDLDICVG